jgi:hypothetical protein
VLIDLQKPTFRAERFLKKLVGINDVGDALQRLDKLTQEEALIAAAEGLMITRDIGDKMEDLKRS